MFDPPELVPYSKYTLNDNDTPEHRQVSLELARQSLVLLKTRASCRWTASKYKRIAVIGPNSDSKSMLLGNYHGSASKPISILAGIRQLAGPDVEVTYTLGTPVTSERRTAAWSGQDNTTTRPAIDLTAEALRNANEADLIIYVGGITARRKAKDLTAAPSNCPTCRSNSFRRCKRPASRWSWSIAAALPSR